MLFKLSEKVWWGSMQAPVEASGAYRSILDLANNYTSDEHHYRISQIPDNVVIVRLPIEELVPCSEWLAKQIKVMLDAIDELQLYPLLVHCGAGWHRSPIVAVYAEWLRGPRTLESLTTLRDKMLELRPDCATHLPFHRSFYESLVENLKKDGVMA